MFKGFVASQTKLQTKRQITHLSTRDAHLLTCVIGSSIIFDWVGRQGTRALLWQEQHLALPFPVFVIQLQKVIYFCYFLEVLSKF